MAMGFIMNGRTEKKRVEKGPWENTGRIKEKGKKNT